MSKKSSNTCSDSMVLEDPRLLEEGITQRRGRQIERISPVCKRKAIDQGSLIELWLTQPILRSKTRYTWEPIRLALILSQGEERLYRKDIIRAFVHSGTLQNDIIRQENPRWQRSTLVVLCYNEQYIEYTGSVCSSCLIKKETIPVTIAFLWPDSSTSKSMLIAARTTADHCRWFRTLLSNTVWRPTVG